MNGRQLHKAFVVAALVSLVGCASLTPQMPRLRVTNSGSTAIPKLTVLFPQDRIDFGDISPGATTTYRHVPNGVYGYAAYTLEINGQVVNQPVIDWVGAQPLDGTAFTYTLEVDPGRPPLQIVQLIRVTKDE